MYLAKSPFWLKWLYPQLTWHMSRTAKRIFLTFDDGPIPDVTPFVLKTLAAYQAKATFFCIGDNVQKHTDIYQQLITDGHRTANHTFNHLNGWQTADAHYLQNIADCTRLVQTNLFRPPYGRIKRSQAAALLHKNPDWKIIMWDVLSGDFDSRLLPEKCLKNVTGNAANGSIIVFHDSLKAYPRLEHTLPNALDFFSKKGFEFGLL